MEHGWLHTVDSLNAVTARAYELADSATGEQAGG